MAGLPHHEREVTTLKEMLAKLDIHDVCRTNHPDRKEYTWSKPTPFTARIIDYIFCDTTSLTKITNSSIEDFSHSDHKLVKVQINMNSFRRGPGYWKFNSSLLSEADFSHIHSHTHSMHTPKKKKKALNLPNMMPSFTGPLPVHRGDGRRSGGLALASEDCSTSEAFPPRTVLTENICRCVQQILQHFTTKMPFLTTSRITFSCLASVAPQADS